MSCKIKVKGAYMDSEQYPEFVLKYMSGKGPYVEMPQEMVIESLQQIDEHLIMDKEIHQYYWKDSPKPNHEKGEEFISGTQLGDTFMGKNLTSSVQGEMSRDAGNTYHDMSEAMINGRNEGKSVEEIFAKGTQFHEEYTNHPAYKKVVDHISSLYDSWTADGSKVLSEFKIANTDRGIAGTIDVAVVHTDGSVTLYDFKGTRHEYGKYSSKTASNNFQLELYSEILRTGDSEIGLPPLHVRDALVIPIDSSIEMSGDTAFLSEATVNSPISIKDKTVFKTNDTLKAKVSSLIHPAHIAPDLKVDGVVDFESFQNNISNETRDSRGSAYDEAKRIASKAQRGENGNFYYKDSNRSIPFLDPIALKESGEEGYNARVQELLTIVEAKRNASDKSMVAKTIYLFEYGMDPYITEDIDVVAPSKSQKTKSTIIQKLVANYDKDFDKMVPGKDVPGLENVGDDVIVVYRNYDPKDGSYSHVELISVDEIQDNSNNATNKSHTTIFGSHLTKQRTRSIASQVGMSSKDILPNDRKSNVLMRLGLAAVYMKNANPDIRFGNLTSYSIHDLGSDNIDYATVNKIVNHLKIMKKSGKDLLQYLGKETKDMLEDKDNAYLWDAEQYQQTELESLLNYVNLYLEGGPVKQHRMGKDAYFPKIIKSLLPDDTNKADLRKLSQDIMKSNQDRFALIQVIYKRLKSLENRYDKDNSSKAKSYEDDKEYQTLSKTLVELYRISPAIDKITDMNKFEELVSSAGFTGIPIIDEFTRQVKQAHSLASNELINGYVKDKKKVFAELYGSSVMDKTIGSTTRHFDKLIEEVKVDTVGGDSQVKRKTMRFWDTESENFKDLPKEHQDYVLANKDFMEWFNDKVEEGFLAGMEGNPEAQEEFKNSWVRGHIPLMRSSMSNLLYKSVSRKLSKEGNQGYNDFKDTAWKVETDRRDDRSEYFDERDHLDQIVSHFEDQIPNVNDLVDGTYGNAKRMERMGFRPEDGKAFIAEKGAEVDGSHDMVETNLERVLDYLMVGNVSKKYLEPMLPLQRGLENVLYAHGDSNMAEISNAKEYLKVYSEAVLHNRKQKTFKGKQGNKVEAIIDSGASISSHAAVGWNLHSGMKNFLAGHLHQLENYAAQVFAGTSNAKAGLMGYKQTWYWMLNAKADDSNKLHTIMYKNRIADVDMDKIKMGQNLKAGGQNIFSSRWAHWMNSMGDYFHRSHMAITQMMKDGSWNAYKPDTDAEGNQIYVYDETLDERWFGEDGKKKLEAYKKEVAPEGQLNEDGTLNSPYSAAEIERIKKMADATFESQNMANNPIYKSWVIGRLFGQMNGWLAAKSERWWKRGDHYNDLGKWVYIPNEEGGYDIKWEGHYMEGIWQTLVMMSNSMTDIMRGRDDRSMKDMWDDLQENQKENIGRAVYDTAFASILMGAVLTAFGDDEDDSKSEKKRKIAIRNSMSYSILMGSAEEIFIYNHMMGGYDKMASPFISLGFYEQLVNNLTTFDPEKMAFGVVKWGGPLKIGGEINDVYKEFKLITGE